MSYKFNLDHTLAIADIHDMITIDIKPETRCSVTGGDVEIHGYLTFRGSYLTPELGEAPFEGSVPLDITLPYLGGAPDISPEVISFDYQVENKRSLTLNLEIGLKGYVENNTRDTDTVMDAWIEPIVEEPVYEEAVIEPFEFDTTPKHEDIHIPEQKDQSHQEALRPQMEAPIFEAEVAQIDSLETTTEAPVMRVEAEEELFEEIPYSPLVDIEEHEVEIEAVKFEPIEIAEVESFQEPAVAPPVQAEEIEGFDEREAPQMSESAMALMDELFTMKRGIAFKEQMNEKEVTNNETFAQDRANFASADFAQESFSHEEMDQAAVDRVDSVDTSAEEMEATEGAIADATEIVESPMSVESPTSVVGRQFADGETIIKMVYVEEDTDTLGGVLERYCATLDDVWNLSELADGISAGDCVMLRYEKTL